MAIKLLSFGFVNTSFKDKPHEILHFERTLYWARELKENVSEPLEIASYAHDIERSIRNFSQPSPWSQSPLGFRDPAFLRYHQDRGALIMKDFLNQYQYSRAEEVASLISHHEEGGNEEQDLLMACDSISFFETNAERFITRKIHDEGMAKVKDKLDWMFNRITLSSAKIYAVPFYNRYVRMLDDISVGKQCLSPQKEIL